VTLPALVDVPSGWSPTTSTRSPSTSARSGRRGDSITEADVRSWPTLVRFDAVYHNHFKCNRNELSEMPALWGYARDLFQAPGFGDTIDFPQIKAHYYGVHRQLNPSGIVPLGLDLSGWASRHGRDALGGRPFGDGTAPAPADPAELPDPGSTPRWSRR
jgi:glutathionyl-hydroquinone reductase